jgi:gamma-glutamyltranspeptidase
VPEAVRQALTAKGHKLSARGPWTMGANAAIIVDLKNGTLSAGADPRTEAYAWAR